MHLLCCSLNNSLHFASLKDLNIGTESDGEIGIVAANYTVAVYLHNAVRILHIERVVINLESKLVKIWNCIGTNEHIRIKYIYMKFHSSSSQMLFFNVNENENNDVLILWLFVCKFFRGYSKTFNGCQQVTLNIILLCLFYCMWNHFIKMYVVILCRIESLIQNISFWIYVFMLVAKFPLVKALSTSLIVHIFQLKCEL